MTYSKIKNAGLAVTLLSLGLFSSTALANATITAESNGSSVSVSGHATVNLGRVSVTLQHGRVNSTTSLGLGNTGVRGNDNGRNVLTAAEAAETASAVDAQTIRLEHLINNGAVREARVDYLIKKQNKIINLFEDAQTDGIYTKPEHRKVAKLVRAQTSRLDAL